MYPKNIFGIISILIKSYWSARALLGLFPFQRCQKLRAIRFNLRGEEVSQLPFLIDQIFAKIPTRLLAIPAILGRICQPAINRGDFVAFDMNLFKHRKRNTIVFLAKRSDFVSRPRFLTHEIICWEAQNHYVIFVFGIVFLPISILWRVATFGGDI